MAAMDEDGSLDTGGEMDQKCFRGLRVGEITIIAIMCVLLVSACAVVAVFVRSAAMDTRQSSPMPDIDADLSDNSNSGLDAPDFEERLAAFRSVLDTISHPSAFLKSSSPQSRAQDFIVYQDYEVLPTASHPNVKQRYILMVLAFACGGELWSGTQPWYEKIGVSECDFSAIGCSNGEVVKLSLSSTNLSGSLPREIGFLTALTSLDLGMNNLSGTVPISLYRLTNLREYQNAFIAKTQYFSLHLLTCIDRKNCFHRYAKFT